MGMAASQARLLSLTARIHDVEYQAQQIQSAKLQLALQEDEVYRRYNEALDEETLTFRAQNGNLVKANFDNLFGVNSIKNGLNKNYTLWTSDDELVVPDDVYEAYNKFGSGSTVDPYAFAMHMVSGDLTTDQLKEAESQFLSSEENQKLISSSMKEAYEGREKILQDIADLVADGKVGDLSFDPAGSTSTFINNIKTSHGTNLSEDKAKELDELLKSFEKVNEGYKHQLYRKYGEQILHSATGYENTKFDSDTFNYYLRYAKLIEEQGGLNYVSSASENGATFATDEELFNQMLMSGKLFLDITDIDSKTGEIDYHTTSPASDSNVGFTAASSVDSTKLKKAEAEYEKAMKDIDKKDKRFDMDLNRLETERTALTKEYDSVKTVIKDNVERTFGIFS